MAMMKSSSRNQWRKTSKIQGMWNERFSRNLGWVTQEEQLRLSKCRVGILGAGGVGGQYAEALARLGVGHFVIWDADSFSIENTNRQNECRVSNYGQNKAEVIGRLILDINPEANVEVVCENMTFDRIEGFCRKIDFYFDGLDFFEIDIRIAVFRSLREHGVPAITVAPLGTGSAGMIFTKTSMSFDDYFGFHTTDDPERRALLFITGVSPTLMQRSYLVDKVRTDFKTRRVPSLGVGVYSSTALALSLFIKIALERGVILEAPWTLHYDPYLMRLRRRYVWRGYRSFIQRVKVRIVQEILGIKNSG
jgi:molybdopterin/thiamine biosynthesis adenylyltransferase